MKLNKAIILGNGWVANARHKPALEKLGIKYDTFDIRDDDEFTNESYDFAIISVPPQSRLEAVKLCLNAGIKKLFLEKPLAHTLDDGKEIVKKIKESKAQALCLHNFIFSNVGQALIHLTAEKVEKAIFIQLNRDDRHLPAWVKELPMGIGLDEFPHMGYLSRAIFEEQGLNDDKVIFIENDNFSCNRWEIQICSQYGWFNCNLWTDSYTLDLACEQKPYWQYIELSAKILQNMKSLLLVSLNKVVLRKNNDFGTNAMWKKMLQNTMSEKEIELTSVDMGYKILQDYYLKRGV